MIDRSWKFGIRFEITSNNKVSRNTNFFICYYLNLVVDLKLHFSSNLSRIFHVFFKICLFFDIDIVYDHAKFFECIVEFKNRSIVIRIATWKKIWLFRIVIKKQKCQKKKWTTIRIFKMMKKNKIWTTKWSDCDTKYTSQNAVKKQIPIERILKLLHRSDNDRNRKFTNSVSSMWSWRGSFDAHKFRK